MNKTPEQWAKIDPKACSLASQAAVYHLIKDAQQDIAKINEQLVEARSFIADLHERYPDDKLASWLKGFLARTASQGAE
jgi:hypothetical protein